jgi:hypothetical protein
MTSLYFSNTSQSYLQIANTSNMLDFSNTDDFTIQWWQYMTNTYTISPSEVPRIFSSGTWPTAVMSISIEGDPINSYLYYSYLIGGTPKVYYQIQKTAVYNKWVLFTICRFSNVTYFYMNGSYITQFSDPGSYNLSTYGLTIGNESTKTNRSSFNGYISNFLWIRNQAFYSTSAQFNVYSLPPITGTIVLQLSNTSFNSTLSPSIINTNVITTTKSISNMSLSFNGTSSNLNISSTITLSYNDSFTIQYWQKYPTNGYILFMFNSNNDIAIISDTTTLYIKIATNSLYTISNINTYSSINNWILVTMCYDGATHNMFNYINGIYVSTNAMSSSFSVSSSAYIGTTSQIGFYNNLLNNLIFIKGQALYNTTSNFSPLGNDVQITGEILFQLNGPLFYGTLNNTITNTNVTFTNSYVPACICEDVLITLLDNKTKKIQLLDKDDIIKTENGESKIVQLIKLTSHKKFRIVQFKKDCISNNIPNNDVHVSTGHKVKINNVIKKAVKFVDKINIKKFKKKCDLYCLVLKNPDDFFYANDMLIKSHNMCSITKNSSMISSSYLINDLCEQMPLILT